MGNKDNKISAPELRNMAKDTDIDTFYRSGDGSNLGIAGRLPKGGRSFSFVPFALRIGRKDTK